MVYRFAEAAFECRHSFDKPKELLEMYAIACWKEPTARASTKQDQTQPVVVRGAKCKIDRHNMPTVHPYDGRRTTKILKKPSTPRRIIA